MRNKTYFLAGRLEQLSDKATVSGEDLVSECGEVVAEVALDEVNMSSKVDVPSSSGLDVETAKIFLCILRLQVPGHCTIVISTVQVDTAHPLAGVAPVQLGPEVVSPAHEGGSGSAGISLHGEALMHLMPEVVGFLNPGKIFSIQLDVFWCFHSLLSTK